MAEKFIGVLAGGPYPGSYEFPEDEIVSWPLPKFISAVGHSKGRYVKTWESTGPPKNSEEARGAQYEWDEHSVGKDLSE